MDKIEIYSHLDLNGNNLLNVGNFPQSLMSVKLLHADLSVDPVEKPTYDETAAAGEEWTDIADTTKWTTEYSALCYAYKTSDNSIIVEAVPVANYLSSALYADGLTVDEQTGEVSVLVDPTSEKYEVEGGTMQHYLTVSENGVKVQGMNALEERIIEQIEKLGVGSTWDKINVDGPVSTNYDVGRITGATEASAKTIMDGVTEGQKTLKDLFNNIFKAKAVTPTVTNPQIAIALSISNQDSKILGDTFDKISYSISTNKGSYPYGYVTAQGESAADTGVSWIATQALQNKKYKIEGTVSGQIKSLPEYTDDASGVLSLENDYVVSVPADSSTTPLEIKVKVSGHYTNAENYAKNNLGNATTVRITAADAVSGTTSFKVKGLYPYYYGFSRYVRIQDAQLVLNDCEALLAMEASARVNSDEYKRTKLERGTSYDGTFTAYPHYDDGDLTNLTYKDNVGTFAPDGMVKLWVICKNEMKIQQLTEIPTTHEVISLNRKGNSIGAFHVYVTEAYYQTSGKFYDFQLLK